MFSISVLFIIGFVHVPITYTNTTSPLFSHDIPRIISEIPDYSYLNSSAPLYIVGNHGFTELNFSGDGSEESPYIIENLFFDLNNTGEMPYGLTAIEIRWTDIHIIIRDCVFQGEGLWKDDPESGISFDIQGTGIKLMNVNNTQIYNNTFIYTVEAISGETIRLSAIGNNTFLGNPMGIPNGYSCDGIYIRETDTIDIFNNTFQNCARGMRFRTTNNSFITKNTVQWCDAGIVSYIGSSNNSIVNNTCLFNSQGGIYLVTSYNTSILNNNCTLNGFYGIYIDELSANNTISLNYLSLNGYLDISMPTEFALSFDDIGYGIRMVRGSSNNQVIWNELIDNGKNVINNVDGNDYDYNYYSDYIGYDVDADSIGDTPYDIDGSAPTQDPHPRGPFLYPSNNGPYDSNLLLVLTITSSIVLFVVVVLLRRR
ncbi:MAG: right-handed parallel beta-helix repeat-containing protein [Candidatus Thorarchaeota archaeon]